MLGDIDEHKNKRRDERNELRGDPKVRDLDFNPCFTSVAYQKIYGDGLMIKDITIKLGGTKQAKRQYESVRADIETTFTIPHETAMDVEKSMEAYKWELRRAKVLFREALIAATEEIDGKSSAPKAQPVKTPPMKPTPRIVLKDPALDEDKLFESLKDQVKQDYLNKEDSD